MTPPTAANPAAPAAARDPGSFRDPSGFVFWRGGRPYRQIQQRFASEWDAFAGSALERRLIERGRLLPYETAPLELAEAPDAHAVIAPEPIDFVSYPYEWTFGELKDAALLTLDAQLDALTDGWTLRDASAFNVQFRDGRPVLIDSLSFEPHEDGLLQGLLTAGCPASPPQRAVRRSQGTGRTELQGLEVLGRWRHR